MRGAATPAPAAPQRQRQGRGRVYKDPLPQANAFRRPDAGILGKFTLRSLPMRAKTSIEPELALLMVNLASPSRLCTLAGRAKVSLNPFCGAGTLLLACALSQSQSSIPILLGSDVEELNILPNFEHFGVSTQALRLAGQHAIQDVLCSWPALWKNNVFVDCIVTDPPYGMGARIFQRSEGDGESESEGDDNVVGALLRLAEQRLSMGGRVVFFNPWHPPAPKLLASACPSLRTIAIFEQRFSSTFSRFLCVLEYGVLASPKP